MATPINRTAWLFSDPYKAADERRGRSGGAALIDIQRNDCGRGHYLERTFWPFTNRACKRVLCQDGRWRLRENTVWLGNTEGPIF